MKKPRVLIVDDELQIRRLLRVALEGAGYEVAEADAGQLGLQLAATSRPDAILLDLGLPDLDGHAVLQRLREWSSTPVIVLTVRDAEVDKVAALDAGADDYVTKPFSTAELLARLRAAQRRVQPHAETSVFEREGLRIDFAAHHAERDGEELHFTATEWALLALFVRHAGRVITHRQILREVWGPNAEDHRQYLRVYVTHLRKKIERTPADPRLLRTETGIGYRFAGAEGA